NQEEETIITKNRSHFKKVLREKISDIQQYIYILTRIDDSDIEMYNKEKEGPDQNPNKEDTKETWQVQSN
ncbi:6153_t:CDS:1, partial [Acaulospora colombiana]